MKSIIQFRVYKGEKYYIGEGIDLAIVTQGKTIEETLSNLQSALRLHMKGENFSDLDIVPHPAILVNFELEMAYASTKKTV